MWSLSEVHSFAHKSSEDKMDIKALKGEGILKCKGQAVLLGEAKEQNILLCSSRLIGHVMTPLGYWFKEEELGERRYNNLSDQV